MTQVAGTKTANVVFIYNAIDYCSEQTVETSKIIHLKINYVHIVNFVDRQRRHGSSGGEAKGRGGAHRGGGRLGQEPQDINQVRPA